MQGRISAESSCRWYLCNSFGIGCRVITITKEFFDFAKVGEFRLTVCVRCHKTMWPNSSFCCYCFSRTTFKKIDSYGIIKEVATRLVGTRKEVYGVVEIRGIRVIGTLFANASPGGKVRIGECGITTDGCFFCCFESIDSSGEV